MSEVKSRKLESDSADACYYDPSEDRYSIESDYTAALKALVVDDDLADQQIMGRTLS